MFLWARPSPIIGFSSISQSKRIIDELKTPVLYPPPGDGREGVRCLRACFALGVRLSQNMTGSMPVVELKSM